MEHFKINNLMIKYFLIVVFSNFLVISYGQDYNPSYGWVSPDNQKIYFENYTSNLKGLERVKCSDLNSDKVDLKSYRGIALSYTNADIIDTSKFLKLTNLETLKIRPGGADISIYYKNLSLLGAILPKMISVKNIHVLNPNDAFLKGVSQLSSLEKIQISHPSASLKREGWKGLKSLVYSGSVEYFDIQYMYELDSLRLSGTSLHEYKDKIIENNNLTNFYYEGMLGISDLEVISRKIKLKSLFLSASPPRPFDLPLTIDFKKLDFSDLEVLYIDNYYKSIQPLTIKNLHKLKKLKEVSFKWCTLDSKMKKSKSIHTVDLYFPFYESFNKPFLPPNLHSLTFNFIDRYHDGMNTEKYELLKAPIEFSLQFMENIEKIDTLKMRGLHRIRSIKYSNYKDTGLRIVFVDDEFILNLPKIKMLNLEGNLFFKSFDEFIINEKFSNLLITDYLVKSHFETLCKSTNIDSLTIVPSLHGDNRLYIGKDGQKIPQSIAYHYVFRGNKKRVHQLGECLPNTKINTELLFKERWTDLKYEGEGVDD